MHLLFPWPFAEAIGFPVLTLGTPGVFLDLKPQAIYLLRTSGQCPPTAGNLKAPHFPHLCATCQAKTLRLLLSHRHPYPHLDLSLDSAHSPLASSSSSTIS
ncbi:hypothetical protein CRENBAI_014752 [Crenichthys baileyi]|uniref:Uncharacterized protein n=1 Tax=Crenichthys baileyi TaxID=28760 RepID=A0AAV9QXL4_9TELE